MLPVGQTEAPPAYQLDQSDRIVANRWNSAAEEYEKVVDVAPESAATIPNAQNTNAQSIHKVVDVAPESAATIPNAQSISFICTLIYSPNEERPRDGCIS